MGSQVLTVSELQDKVALYRKLNAIVNPPWQALPHQEPPPGDWYFWLMEMGRGTGKTAAAAHYVQAHLNGPPCIRGRGRAPHRVLLVAPTIGDGIESAELNDQALTTIEPGAKYTASKGGAGVIWPNKSQVRIVGTHSKEDIERLRAAGNSCLIWGEELAAWRWIKEAFDIMLPGLRVGPHPQIIATTTPKPRPAYVEAREMADEITHATMRDNPHLNPQQKERLLDLYEGTSIGQQEIEGKLIEEAQGALWDRGMIARDRLTSFEGLGRTVVAVDPPGGVTEAGLVVCALLPDCRCGGARLPHYAVLEDQSAKLSPEGWGSRSVAMYEDWDADRIVAEKNFGGDMVESTIRTVDPDVPVKLVHASRGKRIRAEPIQALYEQHRVHHIGEHVDLESEMVLWVPDESEWSPNRIDALVWGLTELSSGRQARKPLVGWKSDPALKKPRGTG
jgi:phage terminase large subunit-like protein